MLLAHAAEALAEFGDYDLYTPGQRTCPSCLVLELQKKAMPGPFGARKLYAYPDDALEDVYARVTARCYVALRERSAAAPVKEGPDSM